MPPPLVLSSYSLGTQVEFGDRVAAAAHAGFDGIGLRVENWRVARDQGLDAAAMADIADAAGIRIREVEYLTGWGTAADRTPEQQSAEAELFALARAFGIRHVNAGLLEHHPLPTVVRAFAELCDRAGDLVVALEFMPYSGIPDLIAAWSVVGQAGRGNGALLVDLWHWARAGVGSADLAGVPPDRIVSVQLCDTRPAAGPPLRSEALSGRLPPGTGCGDNVGVLRVLREHGVLPDVFAVEVISDELLAGGIERAARIDHDAAEIVLKEAGWLTR